MNENPQTLKIKKPLVKAVRKYLDSRKGMNMMFRITDENGMTVETFNDNETLSFLKRVKDESAFELIDDYNRKPEKFRATYITVGLKVKGFFLTNKPDKEKERKEFIEFMKKLGI